MGWASSDDGSRRRVAGRVARRHGDRMLRKYFLLPLLLSVPLYIVGWDIGRWFAVTCSSYVMIVLAGAVHRIESDDVGSNPGVRGRVGRVGPTLSDAPAEIMAMMFVVWFVRLPHCCNSGLNMLPVPVRSLLTTLFDLP